MYRYFALLADGSQMWLWEPELFDHDVVGLLKIDSVHFAYTA